MVQHLGALVICKAHILKPDIPLQQTNVPLAGCGRFGRRVHELHKSLEARHPRLVLLYKGNELFNRGQKHADKQQIGHIVAHADLSVKREQAANQHHHEV